MYQKYGKRLFDVIFSLFGLLLLSPVMLILTVCIRIKMGKPVIFIQERPGKNEKIFRLYKFRTMSEKKDSSGKLLPDSQRLCRFGKVLRAASLDELPELINILKGDMSFVGPRPLLTEYLERYSDEEKHRHDVRPGLTGLAQVNGRNALSWEEKFYYDLKYIHDITFWNDIKIIVLTVIKIFHFNEINSPTAATMEEFKGNCVEIREDK